MVRTQSVVNLSAQLASMANSALKELLVALPVRIAALGSLLRKNALHRLTGNVTNVLLANRQSNRQLVVPLLAPLVLMALLLL